MPKTFPLPISSKIEADRTSEPPWATPVSIIKSGFMDQINSCKTKISLAMTNSVPAGIYAKSYLENTGIWKKIGKNYVESSHVRAALNYVARNDLEYGIVYKTEAIGNKNVKIVYYLEGEKHKKIIYPIAILNNKKETLEVYNFLLDKKNLTKNLKWGFEILK